MAFLQKFVTAKKAVAYYRHSAEDKQENSVAIQREHTEKFAAKENIEIIHEEADEGLSGLTENRPGFQRLLDNWVLNPQAPNFQYILVYDVSRFSRFQELNKTPYYIYKCEKRGKKVIFVDDGMPKEGQEQVNGLITLVKQFNAADFSRQLSGKVFHGSVKVSQQGYSAGGTSCYGLARLLLDENRKPVQMLKPGDHKMISNQRVTFVPLNDQTTETVQEIFNLLINGWNRPKEIADILNDRGIPSPSGSSWTGGKVMHILTNEAYCGTRIYNKRWGRLKQKGHKNPRSEWVITRDAFPAVISYDIFNKAKENLYWQLPTQWRRGINAIRRARGTIFKELTTLMAAQNMHEDDIQPFLKKFPIIFGINFHKNNILHWCFIGSEHFHNHEYALGISVSLDSKDPIERVFKIPTNDFKLGNFFVLSEDNPDFKNYLISNDQVEKEVINLVSQKSW